MRSPLRLALAAALLATTALPAAAQQPARPPIGGLPGLAADLAADLADVEQKIVALARAIPAERYDWRPGEGTRSVGEVLLHVAGDNYLLPAIVGHTPDPATGIRADDFKTAQAYERRRLDRNATIAEVERSFAHLRRSLGATPHARLADTVSMFGQPATVQRTWLVTATHLHEHLGQLIAYARSVGVVPPWSRGG